eukprot:6833639-Prymnesium_polylepis.2
MQYEVPYWGTTLHSAGPGSPSARADDSATERFLFFLRERCQGSSMILLGLVFARNRSAHKVERAPNPQHPPPIQLWANVSDALARSNVPLPATPFIPSIRPTFLSVYYLKRAVQGTL